VEKSPTNVVYEFDSFLLDPVERRLLHKGHPRPLAPKAFDILLVLVKNQGRLVEKHLLMNAVWPDAAVEEGNLNFNIHLVRKTLGQAEGSGVEYIETVPRRGYRFAGVVTDRTREETRITAAAQRVSIESSGPFGGYWRFVGMTGAVYASLFGISILVQLAYQFDKYAPRIKTTVPLVVSLMFITAVVGYSVDFRNSLRSPGRGLGAHCIIIILGSIVSFVIVQQSLPQQSLVRATFQTLTAQVAYLKDTAYYSVLAFFFLIIPFNFIVAAKREIERGAALEILRLLSGDRGSVSPRGSVYLKLHILVLVLSTLSVVAVSRMVHMFNHLEQSEYMNLYMLAVSIRWITYFGLAAVCLTWYYRELNEIKILCQARPPGFSSVPRMLSVPVDGAPYGSNK
jgi:DNA-binding winged helix-turn-helix (wHTH) protein/FtsH-binding integral membrane protein